VKRAAIAESNGDGVSTETLLVVSCFINVYNDNEIKLNDVGADHFGIFWCF